LSGQPGVARVTSAKSFDGFLLPDWDPRPRARRRRPHSPVGEVHHGVVRPTMGADARFRRSPPLDRGRSA
jgi:hypothetical protein